MAFIDTSGINSVNTKLPAVLGQTTKANSLAVVLPSDGYVQISSPENNYQNIRTFVNTVADTEPPTTGFVSLLNATSCGFAEFIWDIRSVGGTVAPTTVRFKIWNRVNTTVVKLDEFTFPSSYLTLSQSTNPMKPRAYPCNADEVYATVSFDDGTSPTIVDGYIYARATTASILERNLYIRNLDTGHQVIETRGYDGSSDSIKTTPTMLECDLPLEEALVTDTAGLTVATGVAYYPSSDGILITPYDSVAAEYSLTPASDGYMTLLFQATLGSSSWTQANNITKSGFEYTTGAVHANTIVTGSVNTPLTGITNFSNLNVTRLRLAVQAHTNTSGALKISLRRKIRGGT